MKNLDFVYHFTVLAIFPSTTLILNPLTCNEAPQFLQVKWSGQSTGKLSCHPPTLSRPDTRWYR